jgi:hypothetical protein
MAGRGPPPPSFPLPTPCPYCFKELHDASTDGGPSHTSAKSIKSIAVSKATYPIIGYTTTLNTTHTMHVTSRPIHMMQIHQHINNLAKINPTLYSTHVPPLDPSTPVQPSHSPPSTLSIGYGTHSTLHPPSMPLRTKRHRYNKLI